MKIGLIGYGKMGKAIEQIVLERGHSVAFKANTANPLTSTFLELADVVIEFTKPNLAVQHIKLALESSVPIVVGTTAWNEQLPKVTDLVNQKNGTLLHASNFSIGVNILFEINEYLSKLMFNYPEYQASIEEIHHIQKLDAPSGTAISLANGILDNNQNYISWVCGEEGKEPHVNPNQLGVTAHRLPDVPGTHHVKYTSEIDTLTISHEAHSRKGFALGAVIAAEWIFNKKGVFTMKDVLNINTI
jgi:4-hydroxy-tetrahydrodipicolinate reductase